MILLFGQNLGIVPVGKLFDSSRESTRNRVRQYTACRVANISKDGWELAGSPLNRGMAALADTVWPRLSLVTQVPAISVRLFHCLAHL